MRGGDTNIVLSYLSSASSYFRRFTDWAESAKTRCRSTTQKFASCFFGIVFSGFASSYRTLESFCRTFTSSYRTLALNYRTFEFLLYFLIVKIFILLVLTPFPMNWLKLRNSDGLNGTPFRSVFAGKQPRLFR